MTMQEATREFLSADAANTKAIEAFKAAAPGSREERAALTHLRDAEARIKRAFKVLAGR